MVSLYLSYCYFSYTPLRFCGRNFGSDCISSWSLLIFYLSLKHRIVSKCPDHSE